MGERKSDEELCREYEADQAYRRDMRLKAELTDILLAALARGPDAAFLVQRMTGHDLVRLKVLHPDLRFLSSQGEPADRIVEILVDVPSTQPFDPHELESAELLRIVKARLWEDPRTLQIERGALIDLCRELLGRLGSVSRGT